MIVSFTAPKTLNKPIMIDWTIVRDMQSAISADFNEDEMNLKKLEIMRRHKGYEFTYR